MRRRFVGCLLVLVRLAAPASPCLAENGPDLPSDPAARRAFVPGTPPLEAVAMAAAQLHPGEDGWAVSGPLPAEVRFSAVALPDVPKALGLVESHVQGDVFEAQGGIDHLAAGAPEWPTEAILSSRPENLTKAAGDVVTSFDGLPANGWIPPDTVLAVGPGHVVEAINAGFAVYSKSGASLMGYTAFTTLFNSVKPPGWTGTLFDPRLLYSAEAQKFVLLALGVDQAHLDSFFFIAVSQTSDPTGSWWTWGIDSNFTGATSDAWLDYAGLGADTWGLYVTGNYFLWSGGYKTSTIISLNPGMFTGGPATGWQFVNLKWPSSSTASSLQPALPLSVATGGETFFVNSFTGFGNQLLLWSLTGDRTLDPTLARSSVSVTSYSALGSNVGQPGSAIDIDAGDARVMNAVYSQRRVFVTLTNDTQGDASSSGAFLAKLNVDTRLSEWSTTLAGGSGWYYFYPAVIPGNPTSTSPPVSVFLSATVPAVGTFASAAVRTFGGPPADTTGPFPFLANGLAAYVVLDSSGRNRWGDYSGAAYDFTTSSVWGAVEYAGTSNTWRTRIAKLASPDGIFADGFESGGTTAWSAKVP